jgi:hypothetical protein
MQGSREELLQRVVALRDGLSHTCPDQLRVNQINEEDRRTQLELYETLCAYLRTSDPLWRRRRINGRTFGLNERGKIRIIAAVRSKMKIRTRVSDDEFGSEVLWRQLCRRHGQPYRPQKICLTGRR